MEQRYDESLALYRKSLVLARAIGDRVETGFEVQGVGMSLAGKGDRESAVLFQEATLAEWESVGADIHVRFWDELVDRYLGAAARALGPEAVARARAEARSTSYESVIERALAAADPAMAETLFMDMRARRS